MKKMAIKDLNEAEYKLFTDINKFYLNSGVKQGVFLKVLCELVNTHKKSLEARKRSLKGWQNTKLSV